MYGLKVYGLCGEPASMQCSAIDQPGTNHVLPTVCLFKVKPAPTNHELPTACSKSSENQALAQHILSIITSMLDVSIMEHNSIHIVGFFLQCHS